MKKFFKALLLVVMVSTLFLSGCNLVQINSSRYYDRVVATIDDITITKQDLINGYSSYGYQYVNYYGYTTEQAIEKTMDYLVNRKLLAKYVQQQMQTNNQDLTITEQNEIWNNVFEYANNYLLTVENTIRTELNMDKVSADDSDNSTAKSDYDAEDVYEKEIVKDGNGNYVRVQSNDQEDTVLITKEDFVQNIYGDATVSQMAWNRYIKILLKSEEGKGLDTVPANVFSRELDRLYKMYEEDEYISLFQTNFEKDYPVDEDLINSIVSKYKELVLASYSKYNELGDTAGYKQYVSDMQSDASSVYWHPYGEKFTAVAHILLKYTDEQITQLKQIKQDYENGYYNTPEEYQQALDNWKSSLRIRARDSSGNEVGDELTLNQVYADIQNTINACGDDLQARAKAFNELIYKYGQDTGMLNADYYYVVNLDTSVTDAMVEPFANEARRLYNEEGDGSFSEPIFVDNSDSSNSYAGYHIIFNVGGIDNEMVTNINNLDNITADELYNTRIMLGTNKTYFDAMYDLVYKSSYTNRQTSLLEQLKANSKVTYYVNAYKDLY